MYLHMRICIYIYIYMSVAIFGSSFVIRLGKALRKEEAYSDSFATFRSRLTRLSTKYPNPESLIASIREDLRVP